ncbi:protein spt2-like [Actinidia eriantha]|uniref:protein spt2-like n=1 Tax=Actinidia eriantha TaxID=165200 RepID=UPI002584460C|nr:protein spt2-like [Actinidia eriantha]
MAMGRYGRDDYEDLDEYEEDSEEEEEDRVGEEEYEEEDKEAPQPTQEEMEYLELRQRLKDSFRKQMKKESGSALANTQDKKKKLPYDNFGSFFGPSQPVIAQRVIQESKSLLENQHLTANVSKSPHDKNKNVASTTTRSKPQVHDHRPKVLNELKSKAQKLRDARDYFFLLSDDAELPAPTKNPPPRNVSLPNSDARSAQVLPKSKQSLSNPVRQLPYGREERKPMPKGTQMHPKVGSHKLTYASKPVLASVEYRKRIGNNNGSGPGRPLGTKGLASKKPAVTTERKVPAAAVKSSVLSAHKQPPSKFPTATSKPPPVLKQPLNQKKEFKESSKGKMLPKQLGVACKPQINKPPAKSLSRPTLQENRPKKKPVRRYSDDEDDDGGRAISMIRQMFRYNPNKYAGRDDDDSDMEANFDDILKEEKRSAKIAREEDEEELRKIEEEERREQLRKEAKKRKLSQR